MTNKNYEYTCINIYSGDFYIMKCNKYYEKETILKGEYACKECIKHIDKNNIVYIYRY